MKKFTIQAVLLILVIGISLYFMRPGAIIPTLPFPPAVTSSKNLEISGSEIKVEIADTQSARSKGLGGRESLATGSGMLFVFEKPGKFPFWMKGVKFQLDFIYLKEDKVVDIILNALPPQPGEKDENLPIYVSGEEFDKVLEVPSGTVNLLKIKKGDTAKLK